MDAINALFGNTVRAKMIRLFLFNPEQSFGLREAAFRVQAPLQAARKEILALEKAGYIKKKTLSVAKRKGGPRKSISIWLLNELFPHLEALHAFFTSTTELNGKVVAQKIQKVGKIRLVVLAGAFLKDWDSRIDLMIVGDEIKEKTLSRVLRGIEADMGRELKYTLFTSQDFLYRMSVYDRLLRDIFDYPHQILVDKIGLPEQTRLRSLSTVPRVLP